MMSLLKIHAKSRLRSLKLYNIYLNGRLGKVSFSRLLKPVCFNTAQWILFARMCIARKSQCQASVAIPSNSFNRFRIILSKAILIKTPQQLTISTFGQPPTNHLENFRTYIMDSLLFVP
mmetsp:Transcript_13383/g.2102  ORF Transcript_13383/g.2102 Transcript_13383/m.2102 type:complete len:119 (+) Transcript_13383:27-383(+)